jgi:hypothetical protein
MGANPEKLSPHIRIASDRVWRLYLAADRRERRDPNPRGLLRERYRGVSQQLNPSMTRSASKPEIPKVIDKVGVVDGIPTRVYRRERAGVDGKLLKLRDTDGFRKRFQ